MVFSILSYCVMPLKPPPPSHPLIARGPNLRLRLLLPQRFSVEGLQLCREVRSPIAHVFQKLFLIFTASISSRAIRSLPSREGWASGAHDPPLAIAWVGLVH